MKSNKITVVPLAGLGNRMRVIASSVAVAKRYDLKLYIAWQINNDLGCDIKDIFSSIGLDYSTPSRISFLIISNFYRFGAINKFYNSYKLLSKMIYTNSYFDKDLKNIKSNNGLVLNGNYNDILIASCYGFEETLKLKDFVLTKYLQNKVDEEYKKIGGNYIGIHIRRTDHIDLIKLSPLHLYTDQIEFFIKENPLQKFFLATDDEGVKKTITDEYKSIFSLDIKLGRDSIEGIHGGVIELYLLSKSCKIICSKISSYSNTAILIGDINDVIYV